MLTYKKFKPYERVLVRDGQDQWQIDFYSHWSKEKEQHITLAYGSGLELTDRDVLPYEGNENLLGTTHEPEEEIKLEVEEWLLCGDTPSDIPTYWTLTQFLKTLKAKFFCVNSYRWAFAIRFVDFNPDDMEETMKHILCVRNGKIVRYKEQKI